MYPQFRWRGYEAARTRGGTQVRRSTNTGGLEQLAEGILGNIGKILGRILSEIDIPDP